MSWSPSTRQSGLARWKSDSVEEPRAAPLLESKRGAGVAERWVDGRKIRLFPSLHLSINSLHHVGRKSEGRPGQPTSSTKPNTLSGRGWSSPAAPMMSSEGGACGARRAAVRGLRTRTAKQEKTLAAKTGDVRGALKGGSARTRPCARQQNLPFKGMSISTNEHALSRQISLNLFCLSMLSNCAALKQHSAATRSVIRNPAQTADPSQLIFRNRVTWDAFHTSSAERDRMFDRL